MTTLDLDLLARTYLADHGATSSFDHYQAHGDDPGFQGVVCASVNDEIVHGIPGPRVIHEGDLVSIDFGAIVDGWHGDAAISVLVGDVAPEVRRLAEVTEDALWAGIAAARVGGRLGDISAAVEASVKAAGAYGIVQEYVGHGIGTEMHMEPAVPNLGRAGSGPRLVEGMALAIEPMVNLGTRFTRALDDGWTVVTDDGRWSAHFEHTVALTEQGPWVLTALDGGAARLGLPARA
jgi:methionyl aminopeptidase